MFKKILIFTIFSFLLIGCSIPDFTWKGSTIIYSDAGVNKYIKPEQTIEIVDQLIIEEPMISNWKWKDGGSASECMTIANLLNDLITYQKENVLENWKYPSQTWKDKGGDCEDLVVLYASVLKECERRFGGNLEIYIILGNAPGPHAWMEIKFPNDDHYKVITVSNSSRRAYEVYVNQPAAYLGVVKNRILVK